MTTDNDTTIHFYDVNDDETFPVYVHSPVVPRVGDKISYWVDYPTHMTRAQRGLSPIEDGEPQKLTGTVASVEIEYRYMQYNPLSPKVFTMVVVYLEDYKVTLYPKEREAGNDH